MIQRLYSMNTGLLMKTSIITTQNSATRNILFTLAFYHLFNNDPGQGRCQIAPNSANKNNNTWLSNLRFKILVINIDVRKHSLCSSRITSILRWIRSQELHQQLIIIIKNSMKIDLESATWDRNKTNNHNSSLQMMHVSNNLALTLWRHWNCTLVSTAAASDV